MCDLILVMDNRLKRMNSDEIRRAVNELEELSEQEFHEEMTEEEDEMDNPMVAVVSSFASSEKRDSSTARQEEAVPSAPSSSTAAPSASPEFQTLDILQPSTSSGIQMDISSSSEDDHVPDDPQPSASAATQGDSASTSSSDDEEYVQPRAQRQRTARRQIPPENVAEASSGAVPSSKKLPQPANKREVIPWKKTKNANVEPLPFSPENTGIQVEIPEGFDEYEALMLFMRHDIWDIAAHETNRYYHERLPQERRLKFQQKDITPYEIRAYVGVRILLGLSPPYNIKTPWMRNSTFRNETIANHMTFSRFRHIHHNFHLVNNATLPPRDTVAYKTARVSPLLKPLQEKCASVYKSSTRELAIDEGSLGWKGHSAMRQYNPNKPHKYHIKTYKLAETKTGYLSGFIVHDTTPRSVDEIVLTLLEASPYNSNEGYAVFTDRFYTSPDLFWHLRTKEGFDATGTCLPNRLQFPIELKTKTNKKTQKGEVDFRTATKDGHALVAMRWKDAKDVFMLSTEKTAKKIECSMQRGRLTGEKPEMVPYYNKHMGGVDLNDYLEGKYSPCRASRKMWHKLAFYLISTAAVNAYIIHRMVKSYTSKVSQSIHFKFREVLGNQMLMMSDVQRTPVKYGVTPRVIITMGHLPRVYPAYDSARKMKADHPDTAVIQRRQTHRCQHKGCKKRSIIYCEECNKCLCVKPGKECFYQFHKELVATAAAVAAPAAAAVSDRAEHVISTSSTTTSDEEPTPAQPRVNLKRKAKGEVDRPGGSKRPCSGEPGKNPRAGLRSRGGPSTSPQ